MNKRTQSTKNRKKKVSIEDNWPLINPDAAGIDLGSREHWVAVPRSRSQQPVRRFGTFTADLEALADWLKECQIISVAMEATGVYWIPVFQILERRGFKVLLVNARQTKNVSGRKSDVLDCQWIQRLHTYGLIGGSFRPADPYCVVRSYLRYRDELVGARSTQIQHMQKALLQMNIQLAHVLSDLSGVSGLAILEAIIKGERSPLKLAALAHRRLKCSAQNLAKALVGDYRDEHLFVLASAYELYQQYNRKIEDCDQKIALEVSKLPDKVDVQSKPVPPKPNKAGLSAELHENLYRKLGVDITAIESFGPVVALTVLTEVGPDLSRFATEKHFTSWLGLCPDNRISGGKVLSCRTRRVINRLTDILRMAATTLERSQSALGAYFRRMKAKLGAAEGITATAHKLARILYRLLKHGEAYVKEGLADYERKHQTRKLKGLQKAAASLGMQLIALQPTANPVS